MPIYAGKEGVMVQDIEGAIAITVDLEHLDELKQAIEQVERLNNGVCCDAKKEQIDACENIITKNIILDILEKNGTSSLKSIYFELKKSGCLLVDDIYVVRSILEGMLTEGLLGFKTKKMGCLPWRELIVSDIVQYYKV